MKKTLLAFCALVLASLAALPLLAQASDPLAVCDLNGDGRVDSLDIALLRGRIGNVVEPGSVGDPNGDGKITINDVRACTLQCTSPNCATAPTAMLLSGEKGEPKCLVRRLNGVCVIPA